MKCESFAPPTQPSLVFDTEGSIIGQSTVELASKVENKIPLNETAVGLLKPGTNLGEGKSPFPRIIIE